MGYPEYVEGKGISSFTISPNGKTVFKKNYSLTKLYLYVLAVIVLCLSGILIYKYCTEAQHTVCNTKECLRSTVVLMNCMNETVDPCEDFYEFSCGMFETNYPALDDSGENSWYKLLAPRVNHKMKKFISQKNEIDEPEIIHKVRMFYDVCLKFTEDYFDTTDYTALWRVWEEIGLDVNYLNDTVPLDLENILARFKTHLNMDIYFGIGIDDDPRNSSSHSLLKIGPNDDFLKFKLKNNAIEMKNDIFNDTVPKFNEYFNLMMDKLLNRNQTSIKPIQSIDLLNTNRELSDFELEFTNVSENESFSDPNVLPEIITLGELQRLTTFNDEDTFKQFKFNWTLYLRELFRDEPKVYEQLTSENSDDYEILTNKRDYLYNVFSLFNRTPITVIKMSVLLRVVRILSNHFPSAKHMIVEEEQDCFTLTKDYFGMVTGYAMIDTLDDSSKAALAEMNENIKWALHKMISEVTWMDDETKTSTYRKLANTKTYFGYPDNYTSVLKNLYQNLNITENHIENIISISRFNTKSQWKYLVQKRDMENFEWSLTPGVINAFNYNSMNAFFMPAAILQAPLYHNGLQALNYGVTGSTIGHELSHNFDNTGRMYNELGNVVQWWTNKSFEEYTRRAGCMVDHYNNISMSIHNEILYIDGNKTLDENIADVVGLKEAYFAYQRYVDEHGQEPRLPGMEKYNPEQLFFLGYALQYCHYDSIDKNIVESDVHSPDAIRVRGVLPLIQEFAKAWSCPVGTLMNPKNEKCQIW